MKGLPFSPPTASNFAERLNPLFFTLLGLATLFAGGVIFFLIYWSVKYRAGSPYHRKRPEHESKPLEVILIGVPLVLGLAIFIWGAKIYSRQRTIPRNAVEVFVIGKQWMWHIEHSNGAREMDRLTIPVGRPVKLSMVSQDVIHEFYVPAFRVQYQVIPGRYTTEWFVPTKKGRFTFLCNMYCGKDHSKMWGYVDVISEPDYEKWLMAHARPGSAAQKPPLDAGRDLFQSENCISCHGAKDTPQAPSLVGIYGKAMNLSGGGAALVDEDYLRDSIVDPAKQIAAGYPDSMPAYAVLNERQIWDLVVYIRSLKSAKQLPSDSPRAPALEGDN